MTEDVSVDSSDAIWRLLPVTPHIPYGSCRVFVVVGRRLRVTQSYWYHAVLQRISDLGCLPITCANRYCALAQPFSDLAPPLSAYVAVDSPDESARCGHGSMIGRAFAAGRPVAPLPRRGTDAGRPLVQSRGFA
jgi:hypothetical protein